MTIDERLDRLTARHEALTESVEMNTHQIRELQEMQRKNELILADILESIRGLESIARAHEARLTRLEPPA